MGCIDACFILEEYCSTKLLSSFFIHPENFVDFIKKWFIARTAPVARLHTTIAKETCDKVSCETKDKPVLFNITGQWTIGQNP